ncbi:carbon-nitrogen hydrolase family protein [Rhizobium grahamii]|uniref:Carbon-nitrogen hydrolase family protein n=1 Tax=Rhizobium grahamii TaxID=1120045 RepID=A0A5Q0CCQ4_9HYPH|nr:MULTISPECIES: carbon-nitrogen hydrolase family protein [Rhizobium]QFY61890.1 carbon-nitrogen hydrolase family protein [Rhizobium grahamii]QRM48935.1 carbon-nitrogen hydrolase family protein [Rhizobium sp. BG6]
MKIAAAQTLVSSDITANGNSIRCMITTAAACGTHVINFCEGALSGYAKFQILHPDDWRGFDWKKQEAELQAIADLCGELRIFAVVGGAHRLTESCPPHNSLYIFSAKGALLTRYDKRFLSNSELGGWYSPGTAPITFEVDGYRFGCAICIESQFQEVFQEYEALDVDAVLFSSYGIAEYFQIALRAHAGLNCIWIGAATPVQKAAKGPAGVIGPDGRWVTQCPAAPEPHLVTAVLDREDPLYDIPLQKARPWRRKAREGEIYREKTVDNPRTKDRSAY